MAIISFEHENILWASQGYLLQSRLQWIFIMCSCVFPFASSGWRDVVEFHCPWRILLLVLFGQIHCLRKNSRIRIVPLSTIVPLVRISGKGLASTSGIPVAFWSSTGFVVPCGMGAVAFLTIPTGFCKVMLLVAKRGPQLPSPILTNSVQKLRVSSTKKEMFSN